MKYFSFALTALVLCSVSAQAESSADCAADAKKMLERMSSTKISSDNTLLPTMASAICAGKPADAAAIAQTHPGFLNITVKQMALKMSTREETIAIPLNDFAASFIGCVRDGCDARDLLTGNFNYVADMTKLPSGVTSANIPQTSKDIYQSNNYYAALEKYTQIDLGSVLVRQNGQMLLDFNGNVIENKDPAGVLSSQAFMAAHVIGGTNRRAVEYSFREFMCSQISDVADASQSDARVGRDVDRFPGGDNQKFQTTCRACHSIMDGFRGAFAHYTFQTNGNNYLNRVSETMSGVQTPGTFDSNNIVTKYNQNTDVYPQGYTTTDTTFVNNARGPANVLKLGWRDGGTGGSGLRAFAVMLSESKRYSQCLVKRVYDSACRTSIDMDENAAYIENMATRFEAQNRNLKLLYQDVVSSDACLGK